MLYIYYSFQTTSSTHGISPYLNGFQLCSVRLNGWHNSISSSPAQTFLIGIYLLTRQGSCTGNSILQRHSTKHASIQAGMITSNYGNGKKHAKTFTVTLRPHIVTGSKQTYRLSYLRVLCAMPWDYHMTKLVCYNIKSVKRYYTCIDGLKCINL